MKYKVTINWWRKTRPATDVDSGGDWDEPLTVGIMTDNQACAFLNLMRVGWLDARQSMDRAKRGNPQTLIVNRIDFEFREWQRIGEDDALSIRIEGGLFYNDGTLIEWGQTVTDGHLPRGVAGIVCGYSEDGERIRIAVVTPVAAREPAHIDQVNPSALTLLFQPREGV